MNRFKKIVCVLLSVLIFAGGSSAVFAADGTGVPAIGDTGEFNALTYNVQGLPNFDTEPGARDVWGDSILIGTKLNALNCDIVALQEDFNYDSYLRAGMTNYQNKLSGETAVTERHQSDHSGGAPLGDGLNIFSKRAMYNDERVLWSESSGFIEGGNDAATYKGFQVTTVELAEGYYLDVYNIHIDEGSDEDSLKARRQQFAELADYIKNHSVYDETTGVYDHAVLVTGDFSANIYTEGDPDGDNLVSGLLEPCHLNDAWAVTTIESIAEKSPQENPDGSGVYYDYGDYYDYAKRTDLTPEQSSGHYDSVERFCYANGNGVKIYCTEYKFLEIADGGRKLSDHDAGRADFTWQIVPKVQDTNHVHDQENTTQNQGFLVRFLNFLASFIRAIGMFFQDFRNWTTGA